MSRYEVAAASRVFGGGVTAVTALNQVTFTVEAGQRIGIVGESGSGKSTLLRLLAALDQPTSGQVRFDDQAISHRPERELGFLRAQVQLVFQDPRSSLNPRMLIGDIVAEPLRSRHQRARLDSVAIRSRVAQVLDEVGLARSVQRRYPHEFSGGQRQRIAIARALAPRPEVLLADEPVSALDVSVRAQVLNLISELVAKHGLTLIFVSHDLSVVRHLCTEVIVLRGGQIVEAGPTSTVWEQPTHGYTRELLAAIPRIRLSPTKT